MFVAKTPTEIGLNRKRRGETTPERARAILGYAVQAGKIERPDTCSKCGKVPPPMRDGRATIQGHHHNGYENPYDVVWLCVKCHNQEDDAGKARGERNGWANRSDEEVREIMRLHAEGESINSLSRRLGIGRGTLWRWKYGHNRKSSFNV